MTYWLTPRPACSSTRSSTKRARATMEARKRLVAFGSMSGRRRQPSSGATSCRPISSSSTCGGGSTWACIARHKATRTAVLSGAVCWSRIVSPPFDQSMPVQGLAGACRVQSRPSVTDGHLPGPVVRVLKRPDHIDNGVRAKGIRVGHLQHDIHLRLLVLGDLRDEKVRTCTVAKLAGVMGGRELYFKAKRLKELG